MVLYLFLFVLLYLHCKKYQSTVLNFVLLFYVAASICGILTHIFLKPNASWSLFSVAYHFLCLFLFLWPIITYGRNETRREIIPLSDKKFKTLSYVLIGLQLFSIIYFAGYDFMLLMRGDFSQIRSEILTGGEDELGASIFRTIAGTASFYYCFNILLFFYSLSYRNDSKLFLFLLIFSSISRVLHSLTYMGRDGILFWLLSFAFSYYLFKPFLSKKAKKTLIPIVLILGGFAMVLIAAISLSRFEDSDSGTFFSLVSYLGQPLNNFGDLFHRVHNYQEGTKSMFPLLFGEKGITGAEAMDNAENFYSRFGILSNVFYSFVGNMYMAWGPFVTVLIAITYSLVFSIRLNKKRTNFSTLIVLMVVTQVVVHNYFYWAYYIRVANLFLLTIPIITIYCTYNFKRKDTNVTNIVDQNS